MKKVLFLIAILIMLGLAFAIYLYNKPHKSMLKQKPEFTLSAAKLFSDYEKDEQMSNDLYLGKIVEVSGTVREVIGDDSNISAVILETNEMLFGVNCELDPSTDKHRHDFSVGEEVVFRCSCSGYMMDVVLNRCVEIVKN